MREVREWKTRYFVRTTIAIFLYIFSFLYYYVKRKQTKNLAHKRMMIEKQTNGNNATSKVRSGRVPGRHEPPIKVGVRHRDMELRFP